MQRKVNKEIKDVFYLFALQGLNYLAPLIVLPYLMVILGAEKFGYIGFSISVAQYLMLITDFGFNLTATKQIALAQNNQNKLNKIFSSTFYAKTGLLIISFFILILISLIPQFEIYRKTMFIMFIMVIGNTYSFIWLFQGLGKIRLISIFNMISKLSILPLTFILVKDPNDYLLAAFIQAFVYPFSTFISILFIIKKKMVYLMSFKKRTCWLTIKDSFSVFLSRAATSTYTSSFIIILGYFTSPSEVGQYSAVEKLMRASCCLILDPLLQVFYPKLSYLSKENISLAKNIIHKILYFVICMTTVIFVIMFFFASYLSDLLGTEYTNADNLLKIMAILPLIIATDGVVSQLGILALGNNKDKSNFQKAFLTGGIVALICIFILVPLFQTEGAAYSLLITETTICLLLLIYGKRLLFNKKQ